MYCFFVYFSSTMKIRLKIAPTQEKKVFTVKVRWLLLWFDHEPRWGEKL